MRIVLALAAMALLGVSAAYPALVTNAMSGAGGSASGIAPPTCSNSLDFSDGCNTQYLGLVF